MERRWFPDFEKQTETESERVREKQIKDSKKEIKKTGKEKSAISGERRAKPGPRPFFSVSLTFFAHWSRMLYEVHSSVKLHFLSCVRYISEGPHAHITNSFEGTYLSLVTGQ